MDHGSSGDYKCARGVISRDEAFLGGLSHLDQLPQSAGGTGVQPVRGVDLVTPSDEDGCTP